LLLASVLYESGAAESGDVALGRALGGDADFSVEALSGYESEGLTRADPLVYSILAGQLSRGHDQLKTRKALRLISASFIEGKLTPAISLHGTPRRTATLCLARAAEYLLSFGLVALGGACLALARDCERGAVDKALELGLPTASPSFVRYVLLRAEAAQLLLVKDVDGAVDAMERSALATVEAEDRVRSLLWVGNTMADYPQDDQASASALVVYLRAVQLANNKLHLVPLEAFACMGKLLCASARYAEAQELLLCGCRFYPFSSSLFKLVGLVCLRAGAYEDAEDALYEANLLDNRSPEVWAYLSLLCLAVGAHKLREADAAREQALRLGLDNDSLMRELAVAYVSVDRLSIAEELLRLTAACERRYTGRTLTTTRKLLADVLAGQNNIHSAIEEYRSLLDDEGTDAATRVDAAIKCKGLLEALGRTEEADELALILKSLDGTSFSADLLNE
jgi:tetratricopeptide (TPR) repeat protein